MASAPPPPSGATGLTRSEIVSMVCTCITTVVAGLGVGGLLLQCKSYTNANEQGDSGRSEEGVARLYLLDIDIKKSMASEPEMRVYLFEDPTGESYRKLDPKKEA